MQVVGYIYIYREEYSHTKHPPQKSFGMDMLPEKSEPMELLGQDPVRCKISVGKKYLQKNTEF